MGSIFPSAVRFVSFGVIVAASLRAAGAVQDMW
jgi:hypothetical protein